VRLSCVEMWLGWGREGRWKWLRVMLSGGLRY